MKKLFTLCCILCSYCCWAQESMDDRFNKLLLDGDYKKVIEITQNPDFKAEANPKVYFYQGKAYEGLLKYHLALDAYANWFAQDTTNLKAKYAIARMARSSGQTKLALKLYEELHQIDTTSFEYNLQLGNIYQTQKKYLKAIDHYSQIFINDSTNATILEYLGDCNNKIGMNPVAVEYYNRAFNINPRNSGLALKTVNTLIKLLSLDFDIFETSQAILDTALVYTPEDVALLQSKGALYYMNEDLINGEKIYESLIALKDSTLKTMKLGGLVKLKRKKYFEAVEPLKIADSLSRNPDGTHDDPLLLLAYVETLVAVRELDLALQLLDKHEEEIFPPDSHLSNMELIRGTAFSHKHHLNQAMQHFEESFQLDPNARNRTHLVNLSTKLFDPVEKAKMSKLTQQKCLYHNIKYLEHISKSRNRFNFQSIFIADMIRLKLKDGFMKNEKELRMADPKNQLVTYSHDSIYSLLKPFDEQRVKIEKEREKRRAEYLERMRIIEEQKKKKKAQTK